MKRNTSGKQGPPDAAGPNVQPDKVGWIRKFCGRGIFREIWRNRFLVLRGDHLFLCEKEVKDPGGADELFDLIQYQRCEDNRTNKSRSKKSHSKFRLTADTGQNLILLAVSPEEKESWINVLNVSITRAKNRVLDQVRVSDAHLSHLTRDRVKIPHSRRLPTRGHLLAAASTSSPDGPVTLDLVQEEGAAPWEGSAPRPSPGTEPAPPPLAPPPLTPLGSLAAPEASGKSRSLPGDAAVEPSMDLSLSHPHSERQTGDSAVDRLQELIHLKLRRTELLLTEVRQEGGAGPADAHLKGAGPADAHLKGAGPGDRHLKGAGPAERLLREAEDAWHQAHEVLEEVKGLRALCRQLDPSWSDPEHRNRV